MIKSLLKSEKEKKNYEYNMEHIKNVNKAFRLLKPYLTEFFSEEGLFELEKQIKKHDASKFSDEEFYAYCEYFFGDKEKAKDSFDYAWLHHQHHNPHHHQYWVLRKGSGKTKVLDMPKKYIVEMVCDWWSFSIKSNSYADIIDWYKENKPNILISENTQKFTEKLLDIIKLNFVKKGDKEL